MTDRTRSGAERSRARASLAEGEREMDAQVEQARVQLDAAEQRLAADDRLGLTREQIEGLVADPIDFTGAARDQVASVVRRVEEVVAGDPDAASYRPAGIL